MEPVLQSLAKIQLSSSLPLGQLVTKTLALVAMATISRSTTLGIMSRKFEWKKNEADAGALQLFVSFLPGEHEKCGGHRGVFVAPLADDVSLDPVSHLQIYKD